HLKQLVRVYPLVNQIGNRVLYNRFVLFVCYTKPLRRSWYNPKASHIVFYHIIRNRRNKKLRLWIVTVLFHKLRKHILSYFKNSWRETPKVHRNPGIWI